MVDNKQLETYLEALDFEAMPAEKILRWVSETFAERAVLLTSFQHTGVAMIHMAAELDLDLRIATIDTLRLPEETYRFIAEVEERYQRPIEICQPDPKQVEKMVGQHGEFLFFDSKFKQEHCCSVRKVRPRDKLLQTVDCWISGLRRDHSSFRQQTPKAAMHLEYGTQRKILKLNPLADWTEEQLLDFNRRNNVPQHALYSQGYTSIGCVICSTPNLPGEDKRAGRWRWFNGSDGGSGDKECGLHYNI